MYGVSKALTNDTLRRHRFLRPAVSGVLRNDIVVPVQAEKTGKKVKLPLRLACVGVLEPRKNQRFLLDVMKNMPAEKARLYLYGTGPDEALLKERVKKENLSDRVHFMGWVPSDNIWPNVDLLLMPSLHEGAPNAVLEALGAGVPVLASDIPEHGEVLPVRFLLPLNDVRTWSDWLVDVVRFPVELRDVFQKCQEKIRGEKLVFDWEGKVSELVISE